MKSVTQEHASGCAVACVAFVVGTSYSKALKLFKHPEYVGARGYYCREIVEALKKAGKSYEFRKITPKTKHLLLLDDAIVFVKKGKKYPGGHYLARKKGKWMDPWIRPFDIKRAISGFRTKLPETPQWIIYPVQEFLALKKMRSTRLASRPK